MSSLTLQLYASSLRVAAAVVAVVLAFDSGLFFSETALHSSSVKQQLASVVGVQVGVAPNDINQLTTRITELEYELAAKERQIAVNLNQTTDRNDSFPLSTFILSVILFILLVLIVLNYVLDYWREKISSQVPDPQNSQPGTV